MKARKATLLASVSHISLAFALLRTMPGEKASIQ